MASGADRPDGGDSEEDEPEDVYEVERIIDMRVEEVSLGGRGCWQASQEPLLAVKLNS